MFTFLAENIGTIIVGAILLFTVVVIVRMLKKRGTTCGCGCSGCPSAGMCHKKN